MEACGYTIPGAEPCDAVGSHFCENRALHAKNFIEGFLVHTKGKYARRQFKLKDWQYQDIVAPISGTIEWSEEHQAYRRQYSIAWIEIARKNGKSELLAAVMLAIMFCDGEFGAEIYSIAKDRKQAGAIFDVAMQMVRMNPKLASMCKPVPSQKRLVKLNSNSIYQVLANDAGAALGSNPSAVAADEVLAWENGGMWTSLRSGMGSMARVQPLFIAATTAGNDTESFGGQEHAEMAKILEDPSRAPHVFVYIRNTPMDADPFDEANWYFANPALGDFLSIEEMRKMALEAKNNPAKLNAFRQFQLNQWVGSSVAWMPMHLFDSTPGTVFKTGKQAIDAYAGKECWFGLDLAAVSDLCSMCYLFPADDGSVDLVWRFWAPEEAVEHLDRLNDGRFSQFAAKGWLTVTEGNVVDYSRIYDDIECDARRFTILGGDADQWCTFPVIQEIENRTYLGGHIAAYKNDFAHMSDGMHRVFDMVNAKTLRHHGNPLARFCFDSCEAKISREDPDLIRPDKKHRQGQARRIDGVPAAIMAMNAYYLRGNDARSYYEDHEVRVY